MLPLLTVGKELQVLFCRYCLSTACVQRLESKGDKRSRRVVDNSTQKPGNKTCIYWIPRTNCELFLMNVVGSVGANCWMRHHSRLFFSMVVQYPSHPSIVFIYLLHLQIQPTVGKYTININMAGMGYGYVSCMKINSRNLRKLCES